MDVFYPLFQLCSWFLDNLHSIWIISKILDRESTSTWTPNVLKVNYENNSEPSFGGF